MECGASKRNLISHRRRHRSASPKLCLENNTKIGDEQCQVPSGLHQVRETLNDGSFAYRTDESSSSKEKTQQSSNVMQLLGVKRREFDELVNQPRSPRVQFMLGLLMKRHKELLLQHAMRSRMSSEQNQERTSNQSEEPVLMTIDDPPTVINKPIKLEGMGASDTIDQLSNILLESSLAVDISSLPQELIDQLGTFLEMGVDNGSHSGILDESSDGEPNLLNERSYDQGVSEGSSNLENSVCEKKEETNDNATKYENETTKTRKIGPKRNILSHGVESQIGRVNYSDELQSCGEEIENCFGNSHTFIRKCQNKLATKSETLCEDEVKTSKNKQHRTDHLSARNLTACAGQPSESLSPSIPEHESTFASERQPQQNSHSTSLQHNIADHDESTIESEGHIIAKLWSIDVKILELMEEKKKLYKKFCRNKEMILNVSDINSSLATLSQSYNATVAPSFKEIPCSGSSSVIDSPVNTITPTSSIPRCPDRGILPTESEEEISFTPRPASSKSPEDFNQETSSVGPENIRPPISPKSPRVPCLQRHERRRNCEKQSANDSPASIDCHNNELLNSNLNMSLDRNLTGVSRKSFNNVVADSEPHCEPASLDLDPDIVEITEEPLEIIYDSKTPEVINDRNEGEFLGHKDAVLALKAAGKYLFACCSDFCVHCYDIKTCQLLQTYKGHNEKVTCLHVELSGKKMHLYSGSHDQQLLQFDIKEGTLLYSRKLTEPIQCMEEGWGFIFLGTKRGKIERYNIKNADFVRGLSSMNNEIMAIQTSKEGPRQVLIVASRNMPMIVRDATTGLLLRTINEETLKLTTYSMYEYHGLVFAGTSVYGVVACDFTNGKVIQTYTGCGSVVAVKVENEKLYAASYNGKIYIYDLKCPSPKHIINGSTRMLLCMDQKDDMIFAGSLGGQLKFWKTR